MIGMKRTYESHELVRHANTVNNLLQIEHGENEIKFGRLHIKMNILAKIHKLEADKTPLYWRNFSTLSTNANVVQELKEGLKGT